MGLFQGFLRLLEQLSTTPVPHGSPWLLQSVGEQLGAYLFEGHEEDLLLILSKSDSTSTGPA